MVFEYLPFLRRVLESAVTLAVTLVLIVVVSFALTRELLRRSSTQADIARLQAEADRLETQRKDLEGLLAFINSQTFVEEEARVKLNLQKPGETVVIVPPSTSAPDVEKSAGTVKKASNPQKWRLYFLSK